MFLPFLFLFNGALCAAALGFAAFVRNGRREAVILATLLSANFLFCNLAYTDFAPKLAFNAIGIEATSKDLWMLADTAFAGAAFMIAYNRMWGWALGAMGFVQLGIHGARLANLCDGETYSDALGYVLHAQLAVFFVTGGPGIAEFLHSLLVRLRGNGWTHASARAFPEDEQ